MKLTDEERRIADDVAWYYVIDGAAFDAAWECAIAYITARREALGEAEPPGTATAAGVGDDMNADDQLQPGDYVLATKWGDGDPGDHFVVGYLANPPKLGRNSDRWMVVNDEGIPFRATGFRRAEKITPDEGQAILAIMPQIANVEGPSLWEHLARIRRERASTPATAAGVAAPTAEASDEVVAWYIEGDNVRYVNRAWESRTDALTVAAPYGGTVVPLVRRGSPRGVVVTQEQRKALVDVRRFFGQRSDFHSSPEERRHAQVISRHVGDLLDASDWPTVMPDGTTVSAAIDAAKGGGA